MSSKPKTRGEQPVPSRQFATPKLVASACLELEECRHDGQRIADSFVRRLYQYVQAVPICPEFAIGLGIPRETIRLIDDGEGNTRLFQPATDRDLTDQMERFARAFLDGVGEVDGFVLKSNSPSCGTGQVKVYAGPSNAPAVRKEAGMFAREVLARFDSLAVEDEGRLRNYPIRHHFLTRLFSLAELRELGKMPTFGALIDFQRRYKHQLLVYDEPGMRELGRLVANRNGDSPQQVYEAYAKRFRKALANKPHRKTHINALTHMYGHFKEQLGEAERDAFFDMLQEYRNHHLPLNALLAVVRAWCARFRYAYLADQTYLEPYPRELIAMRDSGKGLDF